MLSVSWKYLKWKKTPKPYRSTFCSSLHPLTLTMLLFHRYYYVIKLRSKDFMPKLKYNESRREVFFASGVVGLQRMSYLEKRIHFWVRRPALWKTALWLCLQEMLDVFKTQALILKKRNLKSYVQIWSFEGHLLSWHLYKVRITALILALHTLRMPF